jgi:hypothetical protein
MTLSVVSSLEILILVPAKPPSGQLITNHLLDSSADKLGILPHSRLPTYTNAFLNLTGSTYEMKIRIEVTFQDVD